jgi:flagellar biosynthesis protein FlhA
VGRWQTEGNVVLAVSGDPNRRPLPGKETKEPAFGVPAIWIPQPMESQALAAGYSVADPATVIATHLGEMLRQNAGELLRRGETRRLLDGLNESHPKLVEELVPKLLTLGEVTRVLEELLRERVAIRDLGTILEALIETAPANKSLAALVESARQAMSRRIVQPLLDNDGMLSVLTLSPELEEELTGYFAPGGQSRPQPGAPLARRLSDSVRLLIGNPAASALPVLLCPYPARYPLRRWLEPLFPRLTVLSPAEVPAGVRLRTLGMVR